jgi:hypothetical protein
LLQNSKSDPGSGEATGSDDIQEKYIPALKDVKQWEVTQVIEYLSQSLDASAAVISTFEDNQVDGSTFLALTKEDLTDDLMIEDGQFIHTLLLSISQIHTQ